MSNSFAFIFLVVIGVCLQIFSPPVKLSWIGFNCLKARATSRRQFTFYTKFPEIPGTHFDNLGKNERLSRPWSHPVDLNTGLQD